MITARPLMKTVTTLLLLVCSTAASAATHVWTGSVNGRVSVNGNWIGGSPVGDNAADLSFPYGGRTTCINDVPGLTVRSIDFSGAGYTLGGEGLAFQDGEIVDGTMGPNTIACDLAVTANLRVSSSNLTLSGAISGPGKLWKSGDGTLVLGGSAANSFLGTTTVLSGELRLAKLSGVNAIPGDIQIGWAPPNGSPAARVATINDEQIVNSATIRLAPYSALSLGGTETVGPIVLDHDSTVGGSNDPAGPGRLILTADLVANGSANMTGGVVLSGTRTLTVAGPGPLLFGVSGMTPTDGLNIAGVSLSSTTVVGTYQGSTTVDGPSLSLDDANSPVIVRSGSFSGTAASVTVQSGVCGSVKSMTGVQLSAASTLHADVSSYARAIDLNGTLDLAGATLEIGQSPTRQLGAVYTIVRNSSAEPVHGTFAGLPEGALIDDHFRISYAGGDGNDVTLTDAGHLPSNVNLQTSTSAVTVGSSVTVTVTVWSSPALIVPTGTVTISNGNVVLTELALSNGTASAPLTLPIGSYDLSAAYSGDAYVAPGRTTTAPGFSVLPSAPTLGAITPSAVDGASTTELTLTGSGFLAGCTVSIGSYELQPTFVSPAELRVVYVAPTESSAVTLSVYVRQPAPGSVVSGTLPITVNRGSPPPSPITFDGMTVIAPVAPGATAAWLAVTRLPTGYESIYTWRRNLLTDTGSTGLVTWVFDTTLDPQGIWTVADLSTHRIMAADRYTSLTPKPVAFPQSALVRGTTGGFTNIIVPTSGSTYGQGWSVLWARPNVGAWVADNAADVSAGAVYGYVFLTTSAMTPVASSPAPPAEGVTAGDVILAVDQFGKAWFGDSVDSHLNEASGPGQIALAQGVNVQATVVAHEGDGVVRIGLMRLGGSDGTVTVNYATADGSAVAGRDFAATAGTVTFGPGELLKSIEVPLIDDAAYSGDGNFDVVLSDPAGTTILGRSRQTVHIVDNDPRPVLSIHAPASVAEGDTAPQPVSAEVWLTGASNVRTDATVRWFGAATGTAMVSFAPGETKKSFTMMFDGNTVPEPDRYLSVDATSPQADLAGAVRVSITDDDYSTVSVTDLNVDERAGSAVVRLSLVPASNKNVVVTYSTADGTATAGSDYTAVSSTATVIGSGGTISIPIISDAVPEGPEWFTLNLTGVTGGRLGRSTVMIQIVDSGAATGAPACLNASATGPTTALISWLPVPGTSFYVLSRSSGGAFSTVAYPGQTYYADTNLSPGTTYVYRVAASAGAFTSPFSPADAVTTMSFIDDPIRPGVTPIRADHMTGAAAAVNAMRTAAGLSSFAFDPGTVAAGVPVTAAQLNRLHDALAEARAGLHLPQLPASDAAAAGAVIRAIDLQAVRDGCK